MSDVKEKASDLRAQLEERPKSRVDLLVGGVGAVAAAAIILIVARGLPAKTTAADPAPVSTIRPQQPPPRATAAADAHRSEDGRGGARGRRSVDGIRAAPSRTHTHAKAGEERLRRDAASPRRAHQTRGQAHRRAAP